MALTEVTEPMLTNNVFAEKMDKTNSLLATMVRQGAPSEVNWLLLKEYAHEGVFGDLYSYGDQFVDKWKDVANNTDYAYPWRLNHIGQYKLADGEILKNRPCLQLHFVHPFGVQFSHPRAFLKCPDGLSAGTYNINFAQSWGSFTALSWTFTLTKSVPVGGRLAGFDYMADDSSSTRSVTSYGADGITKIETVSATQGVNGTNLGTLNFVTRNGNLNSMQETGYGWNRWKTSAIRQYLNSSAPIGAWWKAQDEWDIAPNELTTKAGFLSGCPEPFINAIKPVEVKTYINTVYDSTQQAEDYDLTYDKVFLPSLEEMYINPQKFGEGEVHEYWKRRSGRTQPFAQWNTYPELIHYAVENHASAQYVRLRSASRDGANGTWNVYSSGYVYGAGYAGYSFRFSPLVVL